MNLNRLTTQRLHNFSNPTSSKLNKNNCLIQSIFGNNTDHASIRQELSKFIPNVISNHLNFSNEEEKLLILHHLDFNYDLGLTKDLNHYPESNHKTKIEQKIISSTQEQINNGSMLDMVFAAEALSDISGKDITVNFDHGNTPMKYVVESSSPKINREHIEVQLNNEHFSRKSISNSIRNYVFISSTDSLFMINHIHVSTIDFMVFSLLDHISSLFNHFSILDRYQDHVDDYNSEPSWQSIVNHPNRDNIARKWGHNDFYAMATSQNRTENSKKNSKSSIPLIDFIDNAGKQQVDSERMNKQISDYSHNKKAYVHNNKIIDFTEVSDPITLDHLIDNGSVDSSKWCAIQNGINDNGDKIYQLISKESLTNNLKSGNKNNPITNKELKQEDILIGLEFEQWLNNAKPIG